MWHELFECLSQPPLFFISCPFSSPPSLFFESPRHTVCRTYLHSSFLVLFPNICLSLPSVTLGASSETVVLCAPTHTSPALLKTWFLWPAVGGGNINFIVNVTYVSVWFSFSFCVCVWTGSCVLLCIYFWVDFLVVIYFSMFLFSLLFII